MQNYSSFCAKLTVGAEAIPKLSQNLSYHPATEIAPVQAPVIRQAAAKLQPLQRRPQGPPRVRDLYCSSCPVLVAGDGGGRQVPRACRRRRQPW